MSVSSLYLKSGMLLILFFFLSFYFYVSGVEVMIKCQV